MADDKQPNPGMVYFPTRKAFKQYLNSSTSYFSIMVALGHLKIDETFLELSQIQRQ